MRLSLEMKLMIAKSGNYNRWLPLWVHATDTAEVIQELIHLRYSALSELCGMSFDTFKRTAVLLAYLHDIGKITPLFQSQILKALPARRSLFEHYGIYNIPENFKDKDKSHHTKCGEAILLKMGFPKGFSSVVGAHHGMPAENLRNHCQKYPGHFYGKPKEYELWERLYREWADFSLEQAGFCDVSEVPAFGRKAGILLSALLIMADWLASNQMNFQLLDEDMLLSENEYPKDRCYHALQKVRLPESCEFYQERIGDEDFKKRFGFHMNGIQNDVISAIESCTAPGLLILEAPMGIGKTEAALAAAEILSAKCGKTGLYFGLPTQATANGIFERVVTWAGMQSYNSVHSINLVHGSAEFQPVFAELKNESMLQTDMDGESGLEVNSFFSGGKTSLLTDFAVATVDRLLMSVLKRKHVMLLHLGLSQKVVIVDEVHSYDAYMDQYLDRALAWLHEYHVPVILLSATLPSDRREELVRAYFNDKNKMLKFPEAEYPRLTYTDGEEVFTKSLPKDSGGKRVHIIRGNDEMAARKIADAVHLGASVGIICNTVIRAQYFAGLARNIDGARVILYHAQYIIPDRMEWEERLKKAIGKDSTAIQRKGIVVVGTQVLEQSLDIDFDILITELCPMDLLLQRMGRLWRHTSRERPFGCNKAECMVLGTEELADSSKRIYTEWLLLQTRKLLPSHVTIPGDIDPLVCETYREAGADGKEGCRAAESDCRKECQTAGFDGKEEQMAWKQYQELLRDKKQRAEGFLMALPKEGGQGDNLHRWISNAAGDNENSALATVRDGVYSIETLVLVQYKDGTLGMLPWQADGRRFFPDICPAEDDCQKIAQQKLRLPARFCHDIGRTVGELEKMDCSLTGFQKSRWLKGQLVLLLNEELSAELCGIKVEYSQENGLIYEKENKCEG